MYNNQYDLQRAATQLCETPIPRTSGYAFAHTTAGAFTFTHYSNLGPMSSPDIEATANVGRPASACPVDFHPFVIQETCLVEKGNAGIPELKYSLAKVMLANRGILLPNKHGLKGKYKSERAFSFDAFCAACATPTSTNEDKKDNFYTRGVHGMIVVILFQFAKAYAFEKPQKRLVRFEAALRSALDLLSLRLAAHGEQWRDVLLPRTEEEAKLAQGIELVNYAWISYNVGELLETRGDYNGAAAHYEKTCTLIAEARKPGQALVDFQKNSTLVPGGLQGGGNEHLSLMQNSWGLALKRAGRLPEAMQAYKKALATDPNSSNVKNNMERCRNAMRHGVENPNKGDLQKVYAPGDVAWSVHVCALSSCGKRGTKSEFKICSRCKSVKYCCAGHQKAHWKEHKTVCKKN